MKNMFWIKPIIFAGLLLMIACKKEEFPGEIENKPLRWPIVKTLGITNAVDTIMTTLNGTVNANGLSTTVIFEYGTTTNYGSTVTASQSPVTGDSITNVSAVISGLKPDSTYHFRVKAENRVWKNFYGEDIEFKCPILDVTHWGVKTITNTSATLSGQVDAVDLYTLVTFEYGTTKSYGNTIPANENPVTQNGTYVNADISGLIPCETYHFRVKAVNSLRISYSPDIIFKASPPPTLTTTSVIDITATTALSGGCITNEGCLAITDRGINWCERVKGMLLWRKYTHDGTGAGNFTSNLTGLSPNKTYYVRSYATTQNGTVYGKIISFKTLP
jgi:hypothetical protein